MTVRADWSWWSYFAIDDLVITRGGIIDFDVNTRWLRYQVWREHPPGVEGPPIGTDAYRDWRYEVREGTYQRLWVDLHQRPGFSEEDWDAIARGQPPDGFVELAGQDPREYFPGLRAPPSCAPFSLPRPR